MYEVEYLKEVNRNLLKQLIQSRLDFKISVNRAKDDDKNTTGRVNDQASNMMRRLTFHRKRMSRFLQVQEFDILQYAS